MGEPAQSETEGGTATLPAPAQPDKKPKQQPPYAVVLLDDDDHTMDYVVEVLLKVCRIPIEKAIQLMLEVHHKGRAIVWSGSKELAELKRDQIRGFGTDHYATNPVTYPLGCVIEPLPG